MDKKKQMRLTVNNGHVAMSILVAMVSWIVWMESTKFDCHPSLLINCSSPSYACFSFETYNYICLAPEKRNDGNMDWCRWYEMTPPCVENTNQHLRMIDFTVTIA